MPSLTRPHPCGRIPLDEFDIVVPVGAGIENVLDLQILVEVDEVLTTFVREYRPVVIAAFRAPGFGYNGLVPCIETQSIGRTPACKAAFSNHGIQRMRSGHGTCRVTMFWQVLQNERGSLTVQHELRTVVARQLTRGRINRPTCRSGRQSTVSLSAQVPCPPIRDRTAPRTACPPLPGTASLTVQPDTIRKPLSPAEIPSAPEPGCSRRSATAAISTPASARSRATP